MGMDASHKEQEQELWMAGWVSQLGASPGPVTAEGLCIITASEGWSDFKESPCLLIWGMGQLPGGGRHSPETSSFGSGMEWAGSWQQPGKLPCAGGAASDLGLLLCASFHLHPIEAEGMGQRRCAEERGPLRRPWACGQVYRTQGLLG